MEEDGRITALISSLTRDEKFRLLSGDTPFTTMPIPRLKIPAFEVTDGPDGVAYHSNHGVTGTYFPATICLAATWDPALGELFGQALGQETRAVGRQSILGPGMNICRTPLNGRTFEYYSEDPFLTGEMVIPVVKGIQSQRIAACLKHFACNNNETWRKFTDAIVDERALHEIYLRAFEKVVREADPWMIMGSYNRINGKYVYENPALLADEVCGKWGFPNFIVSDWDATFYLQDPAICIKSKLSLEMPKAVVYTMERLQDAFKAGLFTDEELNDCVRRLLRVMIKVGLFDTPEDLPPSSRNTPEHRAIARQIVEEGAVLLKNSPAVLPFDLGTVHSIYVGGELADYQRTPKLYGGSSAVVPAVFTTVLAGLKTKLGSAVKFAKSPAHADVSVIVTGWTHAWFGDNEGTDRKRLTLSRRQVSRIRRLAKQNPRTVVILFGGGPCIMEDWIDDIAALLVVWQPHQEGGDAVANILTGEITPSGKVPVTYPRRLEDIFVHSKEFAPGQTFPAFNVNVIQMGQYEEFWTWHPPRPTRRTLTLHYDEGIFIGYRHFDGKLEPRFPFGFGLSYTTFEWKKCSLDRQIGDENTILHFSMQIKNTGERAGAEVIQAYFRGPGIKIPRPERELCSFLRVFLEPGEEKPISLSLLLKEWRYYDANLHDWALEPGKHELFIGSSSRDVKFHADVDVQPQL
ncbi:MAG TPA: glycoside hydrolase family 3 C-terminal domain-containing protein [Candidatus Lokiarchaeia archaeon]|nr:glycoside hydrolase family 3 C-terminal domain-containing protein [Candidatus Lokiarchaeia archaeon]